MSDIVGAEQPLVKLRLKLTKAEDEIERLRAEIDEHTKANAVFIIDNERLRAEIDAIANAWSAGALELQQHAKAALNDAGESDA